LTDSYTSHKTHSIITKQKLEARQERLLSISLNTSQI